MSSELPQLMPTIDWHFTEDEDDISSGHGYALFHEHTGEQPIAYVADYGQSWRRGIAAHVDLLTRPPAGLTQEEWTVIVAEVVATICTLLHQPFSPRRTAEGRTELHRTYGRVKALGGF